MKTLIYMSILTSLAFTQVHAQDTLSPETFANTYFETWNKTQSPTATIKDLENFLALLTDDVALIHPPYDMTDTREPNGKAIIRKGMTRWLGANTSYTAKLIEITYGYEAIVIKYQAEMTYKDETTGEEKRIVRNNLEVLELDQGKVAIIRKYGKY